MKTRKYEQKVNNPVTPPIPSKMTNTLEIKLLSDNATLPTKADKASGTR